MTSIGLRGTATSTFSTLVTAVAVGLLLYLTWWLSPVLAPLGLGLFLAALAAPLFGWLEGRGRSAAVSLGITVGVVLAIGGAIVMLAVASARSLSDSLDIYAADLQARYADAVGSTASDGLRALIPPETLVEILRSVAGMLWQVAGSLGFALVIAALLLLDGPRLSRLVGGGLGDENPVVRQVPALARAAVTYFIVRIRVNAVTALGLLVLLLVLGVDDALLWAVGAFFLSFVPYLGLILALIPPTILALAETGPLAAVAVVAGGTALNLVAENVLEPTLTGRALELSTWLVFAMFFFWVWILGPAGALLSMPITVLVVLILRSDERTRWLAALLARDEADAPTP